MVEPVRNSEEHYTYADIQSWPDGERWELIHGVAYDMTPAPGLKHQESLGALFAQLYTLLQGQPCRPFVAPFDVFLPKGGEADEDIDTVVQPDLVVVCDRSRITESGIKGAPDLVVEILSPSTALKDQREKYILYQNSGVHEYWIVHPTDHTVMVYRLREDGKYGTPDVYGENEHVPVGVLEGLQIDLQRVFAE
ncbi:MAG: Uma2 family endonuclease [Armatimonadota bacterium]